VDEKWVRRISELTRENAAIRREWATAVSDSGPDNPAKLQASDALLDRFNTNAKWLHLAMSQAIPSDLRQGDGITDAEDRIRRAEKSGPTNSTQPSQGGLPSPGKHRGPDLDSPSAR
jgi:hypothetical protein